MTARGAGGQAGGSAGKPVVPGVVAAAGNTPGSNAVGGGEYDAGDDNRCSRADETYTRLLTRTLVHAFYWVDDGLQGYMQSQANFSLPRAQSMMMICIGDGICRQSDIASYLRVSKQAVGQGVRELVAKGLIVIEPDPANGRQKVLRFTREGERMRAIARRGIERLEQVLVQRLGADNVAALHRVLELDWGAVPSAGELEGEAPVEAASEHSARGEPRNRGTTKSHP